jgi:CRISPR-associated exonuclease Cas4
LYSEDDLVQISALQHFLFCERQCALIHIEQAWDENLLTAEGRMMHEAAHEPRFMTRDGVRIERGVPIHSVDLGLTGRADVVEFHKSAEGTCWIPFPVEYKHGKPKRNECDKVQLCAQALCLEEMLHLCVPVGAIFYGRTRHRFDVAFDDRLRRVTMETAVRAREFLRRGITPSAAYSDKCESCSLLYLCMPKIVQRGKSVGQYLSEELAWIRKDVQNL